MAPLVSFVVTCMGRLAHVQKCLHSLVGQPRSEVVFVDYSCPDNSGDWVVENYPHVKIVRVEGRKFFNKCEALNAGRRAAGGTWVATVDAEGRLKPGFVEKVIDALRPGEFLIVTPGDTNAVGFVVFEHDAPVSYDEPLGALGYGEEDHDMLFQLAKVGLKARRCKMDWLSMMRHDNSTRTQYREAVDLQENLRRTREYMKTKWQSPSQFVHKDSGDGGRVYYKFMSATPIKERTEKPRLLMVQPGLHGDAIFCAPIAAWYAALGYEVVWPTFDRWTYRALWRHFDYVTPIFVSGKNDETTLRSICEMADTCEFDKVLYLRLNEQGMPWYRSEFANINFVEAKYKLADVPLDEKWNFKYQRDEAAELEVYRQVVESRGLAPGGYALVHDSTWCGSLQMSGSTLPVVKLEELYGYSILDWRLVCERAGEMRLLESALSNFVEALPSCTKIPKWLVRKADWLSTPQYRNGWKFHSHVMEQVFKIGYQIGAGSVEIPTNLIAAHPPEQRGAARVLVYRRSDRSLVERCVRDLPDLLEKYETWINVSRARCQTLPVTVASGHHFDLRLVRAMGPGGSESVYAIEGPRELIESASGWTRSGSRVQIKAQYKSFQSLYRAEISGGLEAHFHENGAPARAEEGLLAEVYGSVYDDSSAAHLDAETLARLQVKRLVYHQDFSAYECPSMQDYDTFAPHPEACKLIDPLDHAWRCAVGLPALKALEEAASGNRDGDCSTFLKPPHAFKGADAWLTPLFLPTDIGFYALAAFVDHDEMLVEILRQAVAGEFLLHTYGDLLLVL